MHDSDKFQWMSIDDALAVISFVALLVGAPFILALGNPAPEVKPPPQKCAVTVAQYGPTERWNPKPAQPACAGELAPLPNHALTYPLEKR
jgi:hypothetical protein